MNNAKWENQSTKCFDSHINNDWLLIKLIDFLVLRVECRQTSNGISKPQMQIDDAYLTCRSADDDDIAFTKRRWVQSIVQSEVTDRLS